MNRPLNRRQFVAGVSGALLIGAEAGAGEKLVFTPRSQLALHGGEKAVKSPAGGKRRWGEPERKQLAAMLEQDSLFYWQGPQTRLLTERFREVCPLRHVQTCSSGTAAIHIAVAAAGIGQGGEVITSADHSPPWQGRSPASSANDAGGPSRTARE